MLLWKNHCEYKKNLSGVDVQDTVTETTVNFYHFSEQNWPSITDLTTVEHLIHSKLKLSPQAA